jgi:hypothetical protein
MPLTIQSLNADSSFLLSFVPRATPTAQPFTVVLDPWLTGASHILHPKFALTKLNCAPAIDSLASLPHGLPDLVLISQPKTDHCHEGTLRQLPARSSTTRIFAHPAAARKIRSWHHFAPEVVQSLRPYDSKGTTITRVPIPPKPSDDREEVGPDTSSTTEEQMEPGEMTIALLPAKHDMTGLHNAMGITYQAPRRPGQASNEQETISILYTPHGVAEDAVLPYAQSHLSSLSALPLTILLHPMDVVRNPRLLGGTITAGSVPGVRLARALHAQNWCSAHDGDKTNTGVSVLGLTMRKYPIDEIEGLIANESEVKSPPVRLLRLKAGETVDVNGSV